MAAGKKRNKGAKATKAATKGGAAAKATMSGGTLVPKRSLEDFERIFDDVLRGPWRRPLWDRLQELRPAFETTAPKLDIIDRNNEVIVRAEVPGFRKEEIEVALSGNLFTLKGQTKHEEKEEKGDYYRAEITQSNFTRTVTLPAEVDESAAKAQMRDGILEVTIPKVEKARMRAVAIN